MNKSHHASPGWLQYVLIAVVLAVVTLIELWAANLTAYRTPILLALTVFKASLVALWYMHLKFDSRLYSVLFAGAIFVFGVPLAIVLIILFQFVG
ncbi:MAG TPA: cytochrome C oxidase subunit IV family protein [Anaerolineae bacterium]